MRIGPISHMNVQKLYAPDVKNFHKLRPSEVVLTPEERRMLYRFFPSKGAEVRNEPRLGRFLDVRG
ncbi:MAG TPA: hypothetical protein EYP61_08765 [Candidatus Latescibacteria bacterium]|nr:hypothetical protein [Candidatus Latescibacterota bacterium]